MSITIPAGTPKLNKAQAFEIVSELLHGLETDGPVPVSVSDLKALFLHFSPPVPAKPKTAEQWVAKAVGVKDIRPYLNYLYSDGETLFACDGHRAHWCKTDLAAGFYDPKTLAPVTGLDYKFPDMKRVIPNMSHMTGAVIAEDIAEMDKISVTPNGRLMQYDFGDNRPAVNAQYVDQAQVEVLHMAGPDDSLRGSNQFGEFVIMPMPMRK